MMCSVWCLFGFVFVCRLVGCLLLYVCCSDSILVVV